MTEKNRYQAGRTSLAQGWTMRALIEPSVLYGANGMRVGPDNALYVAQAFGSQISSIDPDSGLVSTVIPVGSDVVAPDDLAFDSHGTMYITEVMSERVSAQLPDGTLRVIADKVPVANGITVHDDRVFMDEFRVGGRLLELFSDGREPRVIAEDLVTPNALAMGPDGALYFPQVATGEIWRVLPEGGRPERVVAGLALPTAVKFNPRGELFTTEGGSGEVTRVDVQSGSRHVVARVRPGIDNFAFAPDGRLFVSHFIDGGVAEIGTDGSEKVLVNAGLLGPFGLAAGPDGSVFVADGMSLAVLDTDARVTARPALLVNHDFPGFTRAVAAAADGSCFLATSAGTIGQFRSGEPMAEIASDLGAITGIACAVGGELLVCDTGGGQLLSIAPDGGKSTLARGLDRPLGVALDKNGNCLVSEAGAGRVVAIEDGTTQTLISGLIEPHGLAAIGEEVFVLDRGAKSLLEYDHNTKTTTTVASDLAVGAEPGVTPKVLPGIADLLPGPLLPFAGLCAMPDGGLLLAADGAGGVYTLSRARPG